MNATAHPRLTWFPLVPRPRPPGLPLEARVAKLAALAASVEHGTRREQVTRAAEVLNEAALIASDCGVPALARELCRRQYELFALRAPLPGWAVRLALQPVLNIPRQLIRDGHGEDVLALLQSLHHVAVSRATAVIDGMRIDFGTLNNTMDGHKEACTLTWTALLADGTRALTQAGRWKAAAEHAAAHRGIGARLLDGRQAAILALLTDGQATEAAQMAEHSIVAEPWEQAVQAVLLVLCQHAAGQDYTSSVATMLAEASKLMGVQDPATAVTCARIGIVSLDLAGPDDTEGTLAVRAALIAAGDADGYVARDLLTAQFLTSTQRSRLQALVNGCGLNTGAIPRHLHGDLARSVDRAEVALTLAMSMSPEPRQPSRSA
jgi:hypothetical protein